MTSSGNITSTGNFSIPVGKFRELILHDKKKTGNEINFIFLKGVGKVSVIKLPVSEIVDFYRQCKG